MVRPFPFHLAWCNDEKSVLSVLKQIRAANENNIGWKCTKSQEFGKAFSNILTTADSHIDPKSFFTKIKDHIVKSIDLYGTTTYVLALISTYSVKNRIEPNLRTISSSFTFLFTEITLILLGGNAKSYTNSTYFHFTVRARSDNKVLSVSPAKRRSDHHRHHTRTLPEPGFGGWHENNKYSHRALRIRAAQTTTSMLFDKVKLLHCISHIASAAWLYFQPCFGNRYCRWRRCRQRRSRPASYYTAITPVDGLFFFCTNSRIPTTEDDLDSI